MRKTIGSAFIILLVIAAVAFILKDIDFAKVWSLLITVDFKLFLLAVILFGSSFLFWNLRWQYSMRGLQDVGFLELLRYLFVGIFFNTVTPGAGVGGEPVRAYLLSKKYDKPSSKFFGVILGDKSLHLIAFVFFFLLSLIYIIFILDIPLSYKIFFGVIFALIVFLIVLFILTVFNEFKSIGFVRWFYFIPFVKKRYRTKKAFEDAVSRSFKNIGGTFREVMKNKEKFAFGIICSFGFWISTFLVSYVLFIALGAKTPFIFIIIAVSVGYFFGDLSPSPGGVGIMEAAALLIYIAMGINPEIALSVALLDRVISLFYRIGIGGVTVLSFNKRIRRSFKKEIEEE